MSEWSLTSRGVSADGGPVLFNVTNNSQVTVNIEPSVKKTITLCLQYNEYDTELSSYSSGAVPVGEVGYAYSMKSFYGNSSATLTVSLPSGGKYLVSEGYLFSRNTQIYDFNKKASFTPECCYVGDRRVYFTADEVKLPSESAVINMGTPQVKSGSTSFSRYHHSFQGGILIIAYYRLS